MRVGPFPYCSSDCMDDRSGYKFRRYTIGLCVVLDVTLQELREPPDRERRQSVRVGVDVVEIVRGCRLYPCRLRLFGRSGIRGSLFGLCRKWRNYFFLRAVRCKQSGFNWQIGRGDSPIFRRVDELIHCCVLHCLRVD